jgi:hypothetical protein
MHTSSKKSATSTESDHVIVREATKKRSGSQAPLEAVWKVSLLRVLEADRVGRGNAQ